MFLYITRKIEYQFLQVKRRNTKTNGYKRYDLDILLAHFMYIFEMKMTQEILESY